MMLMYVYILYNTYMNVYTILLFFLIILLFI